MALDTQEDRATSLWQVGELGAFVHAVEHGDPFTTVLVQDHEGGLEVYSYRNRGLSLQSRRRHVVDEPLSARLANDGKLAVSSKTGNISPTRRIGLYERQGVVAASTSGTETMPSRSVAGDYDLLDLSATYLMLAGVESEIDGTDRATVVEVLTTAQLRPRASVSLVGAQRVAARSTHDVIVVVDELGRLVALDTRDSRILADLRISV